VAPDDVSASAAARAPLAWVTTCLGRGTRPPRAGFRGCAA
jgi:hypothetical protein